MLLRYQEIKPSPRLQQYVKCYWAMEKLYSPSNTTEVIYPDGCLDLVFSDTNNQAVSFLIGQQMKRVDLYQCGIVKSFGVRFLPFGAYPFFRTAINELTHAITPLKDILNQEATGLTEKLLSLSVKKAVGHIEGFLKAKLITYRSEEKQIEAASEILYQHVGHQNIRQLADRVNLTPRTLERRFEAVTGLSPKSFARVVRFNRARNFLTLHPECSLTALTYHLHHFDQSHFIRDFKSLAGVTPGQFIQQVRSGRTAFNKK